MKSYLYIALSILLLWSCKSDDDGRTGNPNIPDFQFDTGNLINLNLPEYNQLNFTGSFIVLNQYGVKGVVLSRFGNSYFAFELSDPNHQVNTCSRLVIENGMATCSCDDGNSYNTVNGQQFEGTTGQYGMVPYGVEVNGNIIRVFNN